ncbi:hypothetical protein B0T16DRAFT_461460 [Cercophora newfieldiana]|uniref:Uncharacterized protein n=1 Tax=Cercophora newfieldiana TaxID=92897 RepID=A0AA40CK49_9PEZI|nr:hypothetical protein B0T16DRAFT_461460 [Cercophora newfieldiana]
MTGPADHDNDPSVPPHSQEDILDALLHGSFPSIRASKADLNQIRATGTLPTQDDGVAPANGNQNTSTTKRVLNKIVETLSFGTISKRRFEFAEHVLLGNTILLQWHDRKKYLAKEQPFKLENGLLVTYGQICALGGDFFAYKEPICFGKDAEDQIQRFTWGFESLSTKKNPKAKELAETFIKQKKDEVKAVEAAAQPGSKVTTDAYYDSFYAKYVAEMLSALTGFFGTQEKAYLGLSLLNLDHFGADARTAYNAGHTAALRKAASSKAPKALEDAYAMNAFADHYLQDSFAAGHLRVPRRKLYSGSLGRFSKDICAHAMHREDNKAGLHVKNPLGEKWVAFGDSQLLGPDNSTNLAKCQAALAVSAAEVFKAWDTAKVPAASSFGAWQHAPTLESALDPANHPPMFNKEGCPRTELLDKTCKTYESMNSLLWTYPTTAVKLLTAKG